MNDERTITEVLARIEGDNFFGGIYLVDDRVTEASPRVEYMKTWTREQVRDYCADKKWKVSVIWRIKRRTPD